MTNPCRRCLCCPSLPPPAKSSRRRRRCVVVFIFVIVFIVIISIIIIVVEFIAIVIVVIDFCWDMWLPALPLRRCRSIAGSHVSQQKCFSRFNRKVWRLMIRHTEPHPITPPHTCGVTHGPIMGIEHSPLGGGCRVDGSASRVLKGLCGRDWTGFHMVVDIFVATSYATTTL
jgi:hypothetical protein